MRCMRDIPVRRDGIGLEVARGGAGDVADGLWEFVSGAEVAED